MSEIKKKKTVIEKVRKKQRKTSNIKMSKWMWSYNTSENIYWKSQKRKRKTANIKINKWRWSYNKSDPKISSQVRSALSQASIPHFNEIIGSHDSFYLIEFMIQKNGQTSKAMELPWKCPELLWKPYVLIRLQKMLKSRLCPGGVIHQSQDKVSRYTYIWRDIFSVMLWS